MSTIFVPDWKIVRGSTAEISIEVRDAQQQPVNLVTATLGARVGGLTLPESEDTIPNGRESAVFKQDPTNGVVTIGLNSEDTETLPARGGFALEWKLDSLIEYPFRGDYLIVDREPEVSRIAESRPFT